MDYLVQLRENVQPDAGRGEALIESQTGDVVVIRERAVRPDGTIQIRVVKPGWGSSGYYPAEVLERDGPTVYPAGSQMFWNHPTMMEENERPEGDLRDLAAVLVTPSRWNAQGPVGPGLYADAKVFEAFQGTLDEIGPHIGTSIRGFGRATTGEAEGRKGRIITALTEGRSIDFVTKAGAGGEIVQLFEAARTPTPSPSPAAGEGGRTPTPSRSPVPGKGSEVKLVEARNMGEWMEARLHLDFTVRADDMFGEGYLTREERIILSSAIGDALEIFRATVEAKAPHLYQRDVFAQPPAGGMGMMMPGDNTALPVGESSGTNHSGRGAMDELEKAKNELATAQGSIQALEAERDRLAAALLGQEAEGVVREALAQAGLPGAATARLQRACVVNPPVGQDGKLDMAGLRQRVSEAVAAETQYLQEAAGWGAGRIEGMGSSQGAGGAVDMAVVEKRLASAFADLGFATKREG